MAADLPPTVPLFVNAEPETLGEPCPTRYAGSFALARERLRVVVELTERALTARPAELLHAVARMRDWGWSIALDDVGADPRSLALLPLLGPDVIKLDMRLIQRRPTTEIAAVVNAVNAEAERTGAVIVAEGIEAEEHIDVARAMGATLGQGWLYGLPARTPQVAGTVAPGIELPAQRWREPEGTPFDVISEVCEVRRSSKRLLFAMSRHLEAEAGKLGQHGVVLAAFQSAERFGPATARLYTELAADAAFVAALGAGMDAAPAPGVRGAQLLSSDPLVDEWSLVVLGPHFAGALVAVDLGDDGPDAERRFDFALTYERELVVEAANALMARVAPA
jgi:hypothetical protein